MSDPSLSDMDSEHEITWVWTTLELVTKLKNGNSSGRLVNLKNGSLPLHAELGPNDDREKAPQFREIRNS